mgnify:CR=1 FL=1
MHRLNDFNLYVHTHTHYNYSRIKAARWQGGASFKLLPQPVGKFTHQPFAPAGGILVDTPEDNAQIVAQVRTLTGHQLAVNAFGHTYFPAEHPHGHRAISQSTTSVHTHTTAEPVRPQTQVRVVFLFFFMSETVKLSSIEMADALNEDGTDMIKRPYKWFAGIGKADNKQVAIELAQREAYATISRMLNNAVEDGAERGNVVNNGRVMQGLTMHWKQFSTSLQKACEPFGNTTIEYNPSTKMYEATAKVAIRGDRFNQLLNTAGNFKPSDLKGEELEQFIEANKAIMEAARGN